MKDKFHELLREVSSLKFTFKTSTFPLSKVPKNEEAYRFEQIKLKFVAIPEHIAYFFAINPEIYNRIIDSSISTEQAQYLAENIIKIHQEPSSSLLDDLPEIKHWLQKLSKESNRLLDSIIFWRIIYFILAISFLIIIFNFSQIGRYRPFGKSAILDTKTGIIYLPDDSNNRKTLVAFTPDNML